MFLIRTLGAEVDKKWVLLLQHSCLEAMGAVLHCIPVDILDECCRVAVPWAKPLSGRTPPHEKGGKGSRAGHWGKWDCIRVVTDTQSHA